MRLRDNVRALPPTAWVLFAGTFLNRFGTFVMPFLVLYLTRQGYSAAQAGLALSAYGIGHLCASFSGGHLADRIGRRSTMQSGSTLPLYIQHIGLSVRSYGLLMSINGVLIVLFEVALTAGVDRLRRRPGPAAPARALHGPVGRDLVRGHAVRAAFGHAALRAPSARGLARLRRPRAGRRRAAPGWSRV